MTPKGILSLTGVGCLLASALAVVVGTAVYRQAREPVGECEFAERALLPGLLSEPVALERGDSGHRGDVYPFFVTWFDGQRVLLRVEETHGTALNENLESLGEIELPGYPMRIEDLDLDGKPALAVLHGPSDEHNTGDLSIVTSDRVGAIHRSDVAEFGFDRFAVLQRKADTALILAAPTGENGVYAFDTDGGSAWNMPRQTVNSGISTHPDVPGAFLPIGMNAVLFQLHGTQAPEKLFARHPGFYLSNGLLSCTAGKAPRVLAVGLSPFAHETLQVMDSQGEELWQARLPFDVHYLARIEPEGKQPAVIALGRFGELILFDLENKLLAETRLPDAGDYTYALESGPFEDGSWGIVATSLSEHFLYRVDVSLLSDASNAAHEK